MSQNKWYSNPSEKAETRGEKFSFLPITRPKSISEVKKGFARGRHYHDYDITQVLITGKIEHYLEDIETKKEEISILSAPAIMRIPAKSANLIVALGDSVFTEVFCGQYKSTVYEKYRNIVVKKMK